MTVGISFSLCCHGPKLLVHLDTVTFVPNVLKYDNAIKSAEAFDELYGDDGLIIDPS